jgi:hypothetical protein
MRHHRRRKLQDRSDRDASVGRRDGLLGGGSELVDPRHGFVEGKRLDILADGGDRLVSLAGERLVFSVLLNNYPESSNARRVFTDDLAVLLASFAGRSQPQ